LWCGGGETPGEELDCLQMTFEDTSENVCTQENMCVGSPFQTRTAETGKKAAE